MEVQQLYTNCLSEAAYFVSDGQDAAVIDPLRDVDVYLKMAEEKGVKIKYIFETHFHADFVSGHLELAKKTGAPIVFGPGTVAAFPIHVAKDGETFEIGALTLTAIHTPGHTPESTCFLLDDERKEPYCIFTGDTLFVGDVGRPDLFGGQHSKEELAGLLYDSLQSKIKSLPGHVIVYPAHGPGSACGKSLGPETFSTIETQRATNYALGEISREAFIKDVTTGLAAAPDYFAENARINKTGYDGLDDVILRSLTPLTPSAFTAAAKAGAWIIDTRPSSHFSEGFVPDSISIGLDGRFAEWAATLIPAQQPIVLVAGKGKERESIVRLARVGIDCVQGYLEGGYEAWRDANLPIDMIIDIEPDELAMDLPHDNQLEIIDVRKPSEFEAGHLKGALNVPLNTLNDPLTVALIETDHNLYIHCAGGYRSVIAASLLKREGFHNLRNVLGGYALLKKTDGIPLVS